MFKDPFRPAGGKNLLVLCDTYDGEGNPIPTNYRVKAKAVFDAHLGEEPWFGIEQEYTLFNLDKSTPLGWPRGGLPGSPQGPYYCGAGADRMFGRAVSDAHYAACLYAGIKISGSNAEVMPVRARSPRWPWGELRCGISPLNTRGGLARSLPWLLCPSPQGQWEYQVGPCVGIEAGDQLWASRYILDRVAEDFGVHVTLDPKPIPGDFNGAGAHINFSTKKMREDGGLKEILAACEKFGPKHEEHIAIYGEGNERRLTGLHETCSITEFKYGVADRGCSIRIPRATNEEGKGYLEDRRPASNVEPFAATAKIMETAMS